VKKSHKDFFFTVIGEKCGITRNEIAFGNGGVYYFRFSAGLRTCVQYPQRNGEE
jgi:hypothetical protein